MKFVTDHVLRFALIWHPFLFIPFLFVLIFAINTFLFCSLFFTDWSEGVIWNCQTPPFKKIFPKEKRLENQLQGEGKMKTKLHQGAVDTLPVTGWKHINIIVWIHSALMLKTIRRKLTWIIKYNWASQKFDSVLQVTNTTLPTFPRELIPETDLNDHPRRWKSALICKHGMCQKPLGLCIWFSRRRVMVIVSYNNITFWPGKTFFLAMNLSNSNNFRAAWPIQFFPSLFTLAGTFPDFQWDCYNLRQCTVFVRSQRHSPFAQVT